MIGWDDNNRTAVLFICSLCNDPFSVIQTV
jgi:hypothetical protein